MKSLLEKRLADLETEHQTGRKMLEDLDARRNNVQSSMLRIEGAIRVLSELLAADDASPPGGRAATEAVHAETAPS